jgi:L-ribulokinase
MSENPDAVVAGTDVGTLSGRAVVARVRDGAEPGSAVQAYGNAVVERALTMPAIDRIPGTRPVPGGRNGLLA